MGSCGQPVHPQDVVEQPEQMHSGAAPAQGAAAANKDSTAPTSRQSPVQYWYSRAYRALKQRASEPSQLLREYQHVCGLDYAITHPSSAAKGKAAAGRNRYTNVLPYDHNLVMLPSRQVPYINASAVSYSHPSLGQPVRYIATQGPLPGTTADFWGMVLELQVPAVLMLTNCCEAGVAKCSQYFPHSLGSTSKAGPYEVKVMRQEEFGPDCTRRVLQLRCDASGACHRLRHYHFHAWPDHGTPDSSSCIRSLVQALKPEHATGAPIVVHCSAGIGRTGTFCAIDILLQRLDAWARSSSGPDRAEVEDTLDVPSLVHHLRMQRMGMVQTLEQYVFVYKALLDDLSVRLKGSSGSSNSSDGDAGSDGGGGSSGNVLQNGIA